MIDAIGSTTSNAGSGKMMAFVPEPVGDKGDSNYGDPQQQMVKDLRNQHADYDQVANHDPQTYGAWVREWKAAHGQQSSAGQANRMALGAPARSAQGTNPFGALANAIQAGIGGAPHRGADDVAFSPEALQLLSTGA